MRQHANKFAREQLAALGLEKATERSKQIAAGPTVAAVFPALLAAHFASPPPAR
jgi:hypothetical protein